MNTNVQLMHISSWLYIHVHKNTGIVHSICLLFFFHLNGHESSFGREKNGNFILKKKMTKHLLPLYESNFGYRECEPTSMTCGIYPLVCLEIGSVWWWRLLVALDRFFDVVVYSIFIFSRSFFDSSPLVPQFYSFVGFFSSDYYQW